LEKKSKNREHQGASFLEKKSNENPKNPILGTSRSVISGKKIQTFFMSR